ncbi:hypothetical protein DPEC_G00085440 [Dallia pectoralis]|uniref:Uncharacterized protein n=1 Tax=Dallia pectoralis TaxID=75939 RepID=A0ACC2GZH8_DALPE|nr:hypothetical protein DPEC_G00085440 [Dallia pectoralis]
MACFSSGWISCSSTFESRSVRGAAPFIRPVYRSSVETHLSTGVRHEMCVSSGAWSHRRCSCTNSPATMMMMMMCDYVAYFLGCQLPRERKCTADTAFRLNIL